MRDQSTWDEVSELMGWNKQPENYEVFTQLKKLKDECTSRNLSTVIRKENENKIFITEARDILSKRLLDDLKSNTISNNLNNNKKSNSTTNQKTRKERLAELRKQF